MGTVTDTAIDTPQSASNAHLASQAAQSAYRDYDKPGIERVRNFIAITTPTKPTLLCKKTRLNGLALGKKR